MRSGLLIILFLLFADLCHSQEVETFEYDPDTKQKMAMMYDSLRGDWLLINKLIVRKDKNDTLNQKVSDNVSSRTATSRPKIILSFQSSGDLNITEFPYGQRISVTRAKWSIEPRAFYDMDLFFIRISNSYDPAISHEFEGFITDFDLDHFQVSDKSWRASPNQVTELNFVRLKLKQ